MKYEYILLVDLPDLKKGAIFHSIKEGRFYQCQGTRYTKEEVENQPQFFKRL